MTVGQHHISFGILMLGVALALGACSGPGTPPERIVFTMNEVAGSYEVTRMEAINNSTGKHVDLLSMGADLDLTLTADGQANGRLFIPKEGRLFIEDPQSDLVLELEGSWQTIEGNGGARLQFGADSLPSLDGPWSVTEREDARVLMTFDRGEVARNIGLEINMISQP